MSPKARAKLGELHDQLLEEHNAQDDPIKASQLREKIALLEVVLVSTAPISEPVDVEAELAKWGEGE